MKPVQFPLVSGNTLKSVIIQCEGDPKGLNENASLCIEVKGSPPNAPVSCRLISATQMDHHLSKEVARRQWTWSPALPPMEADGEVKVSVLIDPPAVGSWHLTASLSYLDSAGQPQHTEPQRL